MNRTPQSSSEIAITSEPQLGLYAALQSRSSDSAVGAQRCYRSMIAGDETGPLLPGPQPPPGSGCPAGPDSETILHVRDWDSGGTRNHELCHTIPGTRTRP